MRSLILVFIASFFLALAATDSIAADQAPIQVKPLGLFPVSISGVSNYPSNDVVFKQMSNGRQEFYHPRIRPGNDGVLHLKRGFYYALLVEFELKEANKIILSRRILDAGVTEYKLNDSRSKGRVYFQYHWEDAIPTPTELSVEIEDDGGHVARLSYGPLLVE